MAGTFNAYIKGAAEAKPRMPLMHSCRVQIFRELVDKDRLIPSAADDYGGKPLLFFFYGRPAFRVDHGHEASSQLRLHPVCLVLEPDCLTSIERILPFDSGAYYRGMFDRHMNGHSCENFELDPSLDMPARLVNRFFGSNELYFSGTPQIVSMPPFELEAHSYHSLIHDTGWD